MYKNETVPLGYIPRECHGNLELKHENFNAELHSFLPVVLRFGGLKTACTHMASLTYGKTPNGHSTNKNV